MLEILEKKGEILITIILVFTAIMGGHFMNSNYVLYTIIATLSYLFCLVFYDYIKYRFYGKYIISEMGWLISSNKHYWTSSLNDIEASAGANSTIFIVTDDLKLDAEDKNMISTVKQNLDKGVYYIIITSDHNDNRQMLERVKGMYIREERISISTIPDSTIRSRTLDNLMAISNSDNGDVKAYMQLPVTNGEWWAMVNDQHSGQVLENILHLIKEAQLQTVVGRDPFELFGRTLR